MFAYLFLMNSKRCSSRFCKNVVVSKQGKNAVAVLHFSSSKKAQLPAIRITEQPILITKSKINRQGYKFTKYFGQIRAVKSRTRSGPPPAI